MDLNNFDEIGIDAHIDNLVCDAKNQLAHAERMKDKGNHSKMIEAVEQARRSLQAAVMSHKNQDYVYQMSVSELIDIDYSDCH